MLYQIVYSALGYDLDTLSVTLNNGVMSIHDVYLHPPCSTYSLADSQSVALCFGESLVVGSSVYTSTGTYSDTLLTYYGCDSVIHSTLMVYPTPTHYQAIAICDGESIAVGSSVYHTSNTYYDTLSSSTLCDSVVITELNVSAPLGIISFNPPDIVVIANAGIQPYTYTITIPNGQVQSFNNQNGPYVFTPTINGTYSFSATDSLGCVSPIVFYLIENPLGNIEQQADIKLLKITNSLSQETTAKKNVLLFYRYNDGSVEKRMVVE